MARPTTRTARPRAERTLLAPLRLLDDEPAEAAWNMAVDAALLAHAEQPTLRLYGWQPHAVSLGYFQKYADFEELAPHTPVVRRDTGGGAIHHGDELTFSLALDTSLLPRDIVAGYALLHDAIKVALAEWNVRCDRQGDGAPQSARPHDRWCFERAVQNDLVADGKKLLGSAQRRTSNERPRVLHHGSLVYTQPSNTPGVAAIADQIEPTDEVRRGLRSSIAREIAKSLGLIATPGELSPRERAVATQLRNERYAHRDHLRRR